MHPPIEAHRSELIALARCRGVTGVRVRGSMSSDEARDDSHVDPLVVLAPGTSALALGGNGTASFQCHAVQRGVMVINHGRVAYTA